ncbi:MAG: lipopolysaccharide biosynthesis protein, partial [Candidatus Heimdallarchaeaceae archaeon]
MKKKTISFFKNLAILLLTTLITNGLMFLSRILVIQFISEEAYGQVSYIWNACIVIGTILLFGRGQEALINLPQLDIEKKKKKSIGYLRYSVSFYVIFIIIFIFLIANLSSGYFFIWLSALTLGILYMIFYMPIFISIGYQKYRPILYFNSIFYVILNTSILLFHFTKSLNTFLVVLSFILAFILSSIFSFVYLIKKLNIHLRDLISSTLQDFNLLGNWTKERFLLFLCDIMGISYSFATLFIMRHFGLTFEEVAYVSVAFLYGSLLLILPQRIVQAIGPKIVEEYNDSVSNKNSEESDLEFRKSYLLGLKSVVFFNGLIIIVLSSISYCFTLWFFGENYVLNLHPYLLVYIISIMLKSINFYNYVSIRNTGRVSLFFLIHVFYYALQISLLSVFILFTGIKGVFIAFVAI